MYGCVVLHDCYYIQSLICVQQLYIHLISYYIALADHKTYPEIIHTVLVNFCNKKSVSKVYMCIEKRQEKFTRTFSLEDRRTGDLFLFVIFSISQMSSLNIYFGCKIGRKW